MADLVEIDFETRGSVDLPTCGAYVYAAHPDTDGLMAAYWINHGPKRRWVKGQPCPEDLRAAIEGGAIVEAHNNQFERLIINLVLHPRHGWPFLPLEQCSCTAATAAALSLPRSLGKLALVLDLPVQKDKEGKRLINLFSKPRPPRPGEDPSVAHFNQPEELPEDFAAFQSYNDDDMVVEAEAAKRMVPLSDSELDLWRISERINDRGIRIDRASVRAALRLVEKAKSLLDQEMRTATGGAVTAVTQVGKLRSWVEAQGVELASTTKADIEDLLERDDIPAHVRRAVEIRQEGAKSSLGKLPAFLRRASADGRIRGAFLYHAASTGRWSSTGAQLHNLPRVRKVYEEAKLDRRVLFEAIRTESPEWLRFLYGDELGRPLHLISDAIRGFIWAAPGHDILDADYSGIEGVTAAWGCGEDWKIQAIREIAADPNLPDLYRHAAAGIFNTTTDAVTKKDPRRQVGKVSELSLQYQGGPGAFRSMARNYSLKLLPIYEPAWAAADEERREKAIKRYETVVKQNAPIAALLSREEFIAAELVKIGWRRKHPAIVASWETLADATIEAMIAPGSTISVLGGKAKFLFRNGFLWLRLPSGRCLAYGSPRLKQQVWVRLSGVDAAETMGRDEAEKLERQGLATIESTAKPAVTVLGTNSQSGKLHRYALYGGLLLENWTQAVARDLLANGIRKAEAAGYPVVGHVHDEILTEVPRGWGDVAEFERLICELPDWAEGLPLTAGGWRGKRFRKD